MRKPLSVIDRTLSRCLVCGFREVRTDEVVHRGVVLLAECPHCDHRWTASLDAAWATDAVARVRPVRRAPGETAGAA
ncbi:MAG: hypothetical protein OEM49_07865 [Myxococcales bacterium]|nr:hypothetical protein [Myxococcales bacterium]MDH5307742.1 hypothetical protein [Myxococcales bacterium]MDH5566423.1 hypothetical protein [Myxococcales bacterium]